MSKKGPDTAKGANMFNMNSGFVCCNNLIFVCMYVDIVIVL